MQASYYKALKSLRQRLTTNEAFTEFLDTPENHMAISVVAYMFDKEEREVCQDLQEHFDREADADGEHDLAEREMIIRTEPGNGH